MPNPRPRRVGVVLFDGFQLLDAIGPIDVLGMAPDLFSVELVGASSGLVRSAQGARLAVDADLDSVTAADVLLVPGGPGTRALVEDGAFLARLAELAHAAEIVASVCTGAALLASAGLLDGRSATSNKLAFDWVRGHGTGVDWRPRARWVHDGGLWTSSGVTAGVDMTIALVSHLHGAQLGADIAERLEVELRTDPDDDPFAISD